MGILENHLKSECDVRLRGELSYAVRKAYDILWDTIRSTPVLQEKEMIKTYGHIRNGLVDLSLRQVLSDSPMKTDVQYNNVWNNHDNGYKYTMIEVKGAIISPVKTSLPKRMPKRALYRDTKSIKNRQFNLFETPEDINERYDAETSPFLLLTYGGRNHQLEFINLGLPDMNSESWIDTVSIMNAPRVIAPISNRTVEKKLELKLTELAQDMLRRDENEARNI